MTKRDVVIFVIVYTSAVLLALWALR